MMRAKIFLLWLCLGAEGILGQNTKVEPSNAQVDQTAFREVAGDLRCPTCTGLSVLDSDAPFSVQIKNQVKDLMVAGKSHDEILGYFVERYGPWILRAPPKQGVNLLAWIIPGLILLIGPVVIWFAVGRRARPLENTQTRSTENIIREMQDELSLRRRREVSK